MQDSGIVAGNSALWDHTTGPKAIHVVWGQEAEYQSDSPQGCLKGTQRTVLELIKSWTKDFNKPPILWLNGPAGSGKSAVAQTVIKWWNSQGQLGSSYFCSQTTKPHKNLSFLIPSIAIQLGQQHPQVRLLLYNYLSDPIVACEGFSDQLKKLIVNPLESTDVPTLIVIDTLEDSMINGSPSKFILAINDWIKIIPKVKFLMTSWLQPYIQAGFHPPPPTGLVKVLTLQDIAPGLINSDIRVFLKHNLSELATQRGLEDWPTAKQLDLLCTRAAGLFVYAVATVKFLGNQNTSPDRQYTIIKYSPEDTVHEGTVKDVHRGLSLDFLCISTLQASLGDDTEDDAIVRSVLATVVLAAHPLPPSAIVDLTGHEEAMYIFGQIQSLVKLHKDPAKPVLPFHKLLSDVLTSPDRCMDKRFYISPGKFHSELAFNCLEKMCKALNNKAKHLHNNTALNYACTFWHLHLVESREDIAPVTTVLHQFLEGMFWVWLKALPTLKTPGDPHFILDKTISWISEVGTVFFLS